MAYSDDLYQLVRSMTKGEKRRFRLFATRYRQEKIYLRLFDELNRQKEYDEEGLREKFREEAGITQFHVVKNYLYRMIMKSLHTFEQRSSPQAKVEDLITDIRLLYERGLFKQAWKVWRQASGARRPPLRAGSSLRWPMRGARPGYRRAAARCSQ